jgi:protein-S-isoprenylcysteine O-methyltransferase Ste14
MAGAIMVAQLMAFTAIGLLPLLFFRRGSFNLRWWATAIPFFIDPIVVLSVGLDRIAPMVDLGSPPWHWISMLSAAPALICILLLVATVSTHQSAPALWHQEDDEPLRVVSTGPYKRIRHPFYCAFILAFLGAAMAAPHLLTLACLIYGALAMNLTAAREERRLLVSRHGNTYRDYMRTAGRFFPRLGGAAQ